MKLTRDQRRAVETGGRDLVVVAGAGSGKTAVLIERILHLVTRKTDPLELSRILAITFTQKAAREMKTRLVQAFEEAREPLLREQVEWAHVSTIHSFCARTLRENAVEAGVDPSFTVLEQVAADAILREGVAGVSADWAEREGSRTVDLMKVCGRDFEETVRRIYGKLRGGGKTPRDLVFGDGAPIGIEPALGAILEAMDLLPALLPAATNAARIRADKVLAQRPAIVALLSTDPGPEAIGTALWKLDASISLGAGKETKEVLRRVRDELIPAAGAIVAEDLARPGLLALRDFLEDLHVAYGRKKDNLGLLDFNDLEAKTLRMLDESAGVRGALASKYTQILVDEYQDVNPVQAAILRRLRSTGNHFAVGDVKQSIYGFRYSDPAIFASLSEEAGEEGRIPLRTNFRSGPALVEFANHCFRRLFAGQRIVSWSDIEMPVDYEGTDGVVAVHLTEPGKAAEVRASEAPAIAGMIRDAVRAGEYEFRDVAILFRALTAVKVYERALEDCEVPYYVVRGRGFYEAREVVDLVRLLECVHNPRDQLSVAAALRSPFAGLSEDGLLALTVAATARGKLLADLLPTPEVVEGLGRTDAERWFGFAKRLRKLRALASRAPLREIIETALAESGYRDAVWLMPGARRRDANLRKVIELADSMDDLFGLEEFLGHLRESRMQEVAETEAPTGGEEENVVRLLTVHGAKGLEFPVVFLPDLCRESRLVTPDLDLEDRELSARIELGDGMGKLATASWQRQKEERMRREEEENTRLLYVAVTRAEKRLVLCAKRGTPRSGTWWSLLSGTLSAGDGGFPYGESGRIARVVTCDDAPADGRVRTSYLWRQKERVARGRPLLDVGEAESAWAGEMLERVRREPELQDHSRYQNTVSELLLFSHCECCYRRRHLLGIPHEAERFDLCAPEGVATAGGADELPPSERGLLVHDLLRSYDPHGIVRIEDAVRTSLTAGGAGMASEMEQMIRGFYESDIGREVRECLPEEVRREVPFLTRWDARDGPDLLVRGQIDLLYRRPNGDLRVVDYKTGSTPPGDYEFQLAAYAMALERFQDRPVVDACFVYLRFDGGPEVAFIPIDVELRERVEEVVSRFARTLAAGGPAAQEHSKGCRYR